MENKIKLYRCYKATCNKCLDDKNPYITEDEYNELLDPDGKIKCPEGHSECGIEELTSEDYAKLNPHNGKKKLYAIAGGVLGLIVIIGAITIFSSIKSKVDQVTDVVKAVEKVTTVISDSDKEIKDANGSAELSKTTTTAAEKPGTITEPAVSKPASELVNVEHATVKYDYGYYEGPTKNGLPHGDEGIMHFNQRHLINPRDPEERYAEAGEYVSGIFHDGYLVNGKYFGKNKVQKGTINIGR
jgi:hypothetical protein